MPGTWRPRAALVTLFLLLNFPDSLRPQSLLEMSREGFDTAVPPALPAGWMTSGNRNSEGDFTTTASGAFSEPGCIVSTNAAVMQSLTSPPFDFTGWRELSVSWMERRSASHDATLTVVISTDGGATFLPVEGGSFLPAGSTAYLSRVLALPDSAGDRPLVSVRWTSAGDGTGTTGTLRLDNLIIAGRPRQDLSIRADSISPRGARAGQDAVCRGIIRNTGSETSPVTAVRMLFDLDGDGVPGEGESPDAWVVEPLGPGDSTGFAIGFVVPEAPRFTLWLVRDSPADMVPSNDTARIGVIAGAPPSSVIVNEIMYAPLPGQAEYVELFNRSPAPVDLSGWRLTDDPDDSTGGLIESDSGHPVLLDPGAFLLCSAETTLWSDYPGIPGSASVVRVSGLSLNNGGDVLLLYDGAGTVVDRVEYLPEWHVPVLEETGGRSLERIDPDGSAAQGWNWTTSADPGGGTPGRRNGSSPGRGDDGGELTASPNPFSPDGDGHEDVTLIRYRFSGAPIVARARIYDAAGRLVRTLTGGNFVAGEGAIAWNGFDDRGRRAPIGIYVAFVDATDAEGGEEFSAKALVVVAGRL